MFKKVKTNDKIFNYKYTWTISIKEDLEYERIINNENGYLVYEMVINNKTSENLFLSQCDVLSYSIFNSFYLGF